MTDDRAGWHHLVSVPTQVDAHLIAGFLTSGGVRVEIESAYFSQDPLSTGALGQLHLWVRHEDRELAEKLLEEADDDDQGIDDEGSDQDPDAGSDPVTP
jgi:hypothetical protein